MTSPKAMFLGVHPENEKEKSPDFRDKDLHQKLVKLYLDEKSDSRQYFYESLSDSEICELTGGKTLADKFAKDLMDEAKHLLIFDQTAGLMTTPGNLVAEVDYFLKLCSMAEKLDYVSPQIASYLYPNTKEIPGITKQLKQLATKFEEAKIKINKHHRSGRKADDETMKKWQVDAYIEKISEIFCDHHLDFTATSQGSINEVSFAGSVIKLIFDSIPGFDYRANTINKMIGEFKTQQNKTQLKAENEIKAYLRL